MCASGHGSGPAAGRESVGSQVVHVRVNVNMNMNMKSPHGYIET
jgi:hypothetical protein